MTLEVTIRLACFTAVLLAMAIWERLAPRRSLTARKGPRWASNLGLVALNVSLVRLVLPLTAIGTAALAAEHGWGLLNQWPAPLWLRFSLAVAAQDFALYVQHVLF